MSCFGSLRFLLLQLLVFGYMLGLLPECLIIAASMHTRSIFQQPFRRRVEAFKHKLKWDRGMHSDSLATVNAYKVKHSVLVATFNTIIMYSKLLVTCRYCPCLQGKFIVSL